VVLSYEGFWDPTIIAIYPFIFKDLRYNWNCYDLSLIYRHTKCMINTFWICRNIINLCNMISVISAPHARIAMSYLSGPGRKQSGLKVLNGHETAAMRTTTTKRDNGNDNNSQDNHQINTNNVSIGSLFSITTPIGFPMVCRKSSKDGNKIPNC